MTALRCTLVTALLAAPWISAVACCGAMSPEGAASPIGTEPTSEEIATASASAAATSTASTPSTVASLPVTTSATASVVASASASAAPVSTVKRLLDGVVSNAAGKPFGAAVVYLEDGALEPGKGDKAFIDQREMLFLPYMTAIALGGTVTFKNSDPFPHNVYAYDNEKFNLGMISQFGSRTKKFEKLGSNRLLCNLHPGMIAYVVVVPSSYFAITNNKGKFSIKDVPEGTYKVAATGPGVTTETQSVTLNGADATVNFTLKK